MDGWEPPSGVQGSGSVGPARPGVAAPAANAKVLFHPFVGVAPRMYARAFLKDRDYKDKLTGDYRVGEPVWGGHSEALRVHYLDLESGLGALQA
ncbi:hypothetical protein ACRAWG_18450 [Methylobacterium sp. P31]